MKSKIMQVNIVEIVLYIAHAASLFLLYQIAPIVSFVIFFTCFIVKNTNTDEALRIYSEKKKKTTEISNAETFNIIQIGLGVLSLILATYKLVMTPVVLIFDILFLIVVIFNNIYIYKDFKKFYKALGL
jgi:hypothetical protein